ncbi:MAG: precorrin-4 C(11)-methyltransferase, partial [Acidobacteria bacterium]|nr:precorrin-4 C(11)-methyltransferase [Acidobacteriota bacterium]
TPMPAGEELATLGRTGATLAIHLSITNLDQISSQLIPLYGAECAAVVVHRASWPDERILRCTLGSLAEEVKRSGIDRNALIFVGRSLGQHGFGESYLYSSSRDRAEGSET